MSIDRDWILDRIPHQGSMCLIDHVAEWDETMIRCSVTGHRAVDHPLRTNGRLHAACGIEYAAQAMAIHGALCSRGAGRPRAGFLASVRGVEFSVERLDDIDAALEVVAARLGGDDNNVLYRFELAALQRPLVRGRATVILDAGTLMKADE